MPLPLVGAALALASTPMLIVLLRGNDDASGALVAATIVGASIVALAVEDPAGETISAVPTSLARRRMLRLSAILLALAVTWAGLMVAAVIEASVTSYDLVQRATEGAAVAGLAAAAGGLAHRQGVASSGQIGAVAGALTVLVIAALAYRFRALPTLVGEQHHLRWWGIAVGGWLITAWTWRDPARRGL
jgi:hypothetical protein